MLKSVSVLACLLLALSLTAQEQARPWSVTLQAGATVSGIGLEWDAFEPKFRTGFFVGAGVRFAISERWALPLDVRYAQRGFYYNTPGTFLVRDNQLAVYRGRVDHRAAYLDIVPQIEFRPIRRIGIAVGPYLSTRLSEAVRYDDVVGWTDTRKNALFDDIDLGLSAKLSGHFGPVSVFASYLHGLTDSANLPLADANGLSLGRVAAKGRAVLVGVGWAF